MSRRDLTLVTLATFFAFAVLLSVGIGVSARDSAVDQTTVDDLDSRVSDMETRLDDLEANRGW